MASYYTTHDATGKAVFANIPTERHTTQMPSGSMQILSSTHETPINLSTEKDLDQYQHDRVQPFFSGTRVICPDKGTSTCIITLDAGADAPMHRTMTFDTIVILEGELEVHLDSGEKRLAKPGDAVIQRSNLHKWVNVTPNGGQAKFVAFLVAAADEVKIGDKILGPQWG
jgi:quercetin dioxygenase-like cupin family protein